MKYKLKVTAGPLNGQEFIIIPGVNYLVGKNGAGKTQLLKAIKNNSCTIRSVDNTKFLKNYCAFDWGTKKENILDEKRRDFRERKLLNEETGQPQIVESQREITRSATKRDEHGNKLIVPAQIIETATLHGVEVVDGMLSEGSNILHHKFLWPPSGFEKFPKNRYEKNAHAHMDSYFALWDEPETHLHPSEQKKIPQKLEFWLERFPLKDRNNKLKLPVFIIAPTHSPFVLAGILNDEKHNVITLDKCEVVYDTKRSISESRLAANHLLGAALEDLIPSDMIFTEASVEVLITELANKFNLDLEKFIITINGDEALEQRVDSFRNIMKSIKLLVSTFPGKYIFKLRIHAICDDNAFAEKLKKDFESIDTIKLKVSSFGEKQLEDHYPIEWVHEFIESKYSPKQNWQHKMPINSYIKSELKITDHKKQGLLKCELAKFIASKIDSLEDLEVKLPNVKLFFDEWDEKSK